MQSITYQLRKINKKAKNLLVLIKNYYLTKAFRTKMDFSEKQSTEVFVLRTADFHSVIVPLC